MTKPLACHYSVARFAPYPETDEFVNVGVVLACPDLGYLDFKRADLRRKGRVGNFFPELGDSIYRTALQAWEESLQPVRHVPDTSQTLTNSDRQHHRERFRALVHPRESILYYSEPRVILSRDPAATLDAVFGAYVERRFAATPEYQEQIMVRRLESSLKGANLLDRYLLNHRVGDDRYHKSFPFVRLAQNEPRPQQAIKALDLNRKEPTDIIQHADAWRNHVGRLRTYGTAPAELLFVLQGPRNRSEGHERAFDEVRTDLDQAGIEHLLIEADHKILAFAQRGA